MAAPPLPPPPLQDGVLSGGLFSQGWQRWLQQLQALAKGLGGALQPTTPTLLAQSGALYMGPGVPADANGNDGDFYFRTGTPGTPNQRLYVKASGAWVGIL